MLGMAPKQTNIKTSAGGEIFSMGWGASPRSDSAALHGPHLPPCLPSVHSFFRPQPQRGKEQWDHHLLHAPPTQAAPKLWPCSSCLFVRLLCPSVTTICSCSHTVFVSISHDLCPQPSPAGHQAPGLLGFISLNSGLTIRTRLGAWASVGS